jgi:cytochrome P450
MTAKPKMVVFRLRASSSGFWLSSHHIQKSKLALMQSSTRWLAETIGRVRRMSSDFRTFAPSSKRYAMKILCEFNSPFSQVALQVLRTHAPFWVTPPHYSTEDFVYNGMYIPKNTGIILNCYDIHHNEGKYPDAYATAFFSLLWFKR